MSAIMFVRSLAVAACLVSLFACASTTGAPAEGDSNDQAATSAAPSCGASYNKALADYKQAVATANQHKISACDGVNGSDEGAYLSVITQQAAAATSTCGSFESVIKTSPWAAPIRDELKGNLVLPVLEGDLQVKDASGKVVFKGLAAALGAGVTMWGPGAGLVANQSKIAFAANGQATVSKLNVADDGTQTWADAPATYTLGAISGDAITITVVSAGVTTDYTLTAIDDNGSPDFQLAPATAGASDTFTAYISECEA